MTGGFSSSLVIDPMQRRAALVLADAFGGFDDIAFHLLAPGAALREPARPVALDLERAQAAVGRYRLRENFEIALLLAVTAFAELRLHQLQRDPERHDPGRASRLSLDELALLADANDRAAAQASLDGELRHWRDGTPIRCRAWLEAELAELAPLASELGLTTVLAPLEAVIRDGNQAMVWLERHRRGEAIATIIAADAAALELEERRQSVWLQADGADALG
jgi:hypothetical protein